MSVSEVIKEFGEYIGVKNLKVNDSGIVHITIENVGDLFIDEKDIDVPFKHCVYVYLLRLFKYPDEALYERSMTVCYDIFDIGTIVNPVLRDDNALGFIIKIRSEDFTMQALTKSIEVLRHMHDRLSNM